MGEWERDIHVEWHVRTLNLSTANGQGLTITMQNGKEPGSRLPWGVNCLSGSPSGGWLKLADGLTGWHLTSEIGASRTDRWVRRAGFHGSTHALGDQELLQGQHFLHVPMAVTGGEEGEMRACPLPQAKERGAEADGWSRGGVFLVVFLNMQTQSQCFAEKQSKVRLYRATGYRATCC